jgi:hypothetical protein
MKPYAKDYALFDSVLQEARDNTKLELLGQQMITFIMQGGLLIDYANWTMKLNWYLVTNGKH